MKLLKVKPNTIKVPDLLVRARYDADLLQQLQSSIREAGVIAPVIACRVDGDLVLVDGAHRLEAALAGGIPLVDVAVFEGSMVDVLTKNLFLDHLRGKTPVSEMVKLIGALYTEYKLDSDQIKEKTGLSREYIEKLIKISGAAPSVQQALDEGVIGVGHAFELSRLPYAIQQEELIAKHQVWRFTIGELRSQIDQVLQEMKAMAEPGAPQTVTSPRPIATYRCEGCKGEVEPRYLRPVMLCPDCFGAVWKLARVRGTTEEGDGHDSGGG